jgi:hypothetical protein
MRHLGLRRCLAFSAYVESFSIMATQNFLAETKVDLVRVEGHHKTDLINCVVKIHTIIKSERDRLGVFHKCDSNCARERITDSLPTSGCDGQSRAMW